MIVAAFPGTGKTTLVKKYPDKFQDTPTEDLVYAHGGHTPAYFDDFAKLVESVLSKDKVALMLPIPEVMDRLIANGHTLKVVIPPVSDKNEYMDRYVERGSDNDFIEKMDRNWDTWLHLIEQGNYDLVRLKHGEFLDDVVTVITKH